MKLFYEAVEMEISEFEIKDVITTSGATGCFAEGGSSVFDPDTEDKGSFDDLFGQG